MKSEVTKEQIHSFLNGYNPMERIVKIEGDYNDDKMSVIYRDENGLKKVSHEPFYPFCWAKQSTGQGLFNGNRSLLKAKLNEYHISCKGLRISDSEGNVSERMERGYRVMFKANSPMPYQKFMQFFKEGGRPIYPNQNDINYGLKEYIVVNPIEQFMIQTGKRQFKTYDDYDQILRIEFDLETEGLDPQKDCISQIGIRTNRGFEQIIPVLGEGEEKWINEIKALEQFFRIIRQIDGDVLTGHNIENFDLWFIDERLKLRGSSLEKFTEHLFPHRGIYKANKQKVLKLGGEMEYYTPTIMWGTNITDSLFAVRRAQALNSNIKKADLKYITKFAKLNKPNRVYVPGKIINDTWIDEKKRYAHNDENGHWFKITKTLLQKTFSNDNNVETKRYELLDNNTKLYDIKENETFNIVSGRYIVERYLLDDLYETDKVELSFNQTNYQICKMLPVPFEKMCTMGTAAIWKYIMLTWSYENNLAIPELIDTHAFTGGLSRLLVTGYVDRIIKLDYNSLYPSIILTHDINTDIDIMGAMSMMLEYILTKREEYKGEKKSADKKVREITQLLENQPNNEQLLADLKTYKSKYTLFDNMQSAIKVIGNGFFGSYGSGSVFPHSDLICAEETTCTGRMALRLMIGWFTNLGYKPLVGDTDGFNFQMPKEFRYTKEHPYIGKGLNRLVKEGKEYIDEWGDIMEFNDLFMRNKMGLDEDEVIPANITCARKNYLDLLDNGEVKMVGNTLKSKKMPIYIEKFIAKAAELLLHNKGKEFIEYYYDYIEKIYNMQIPLKDIASVGKIKTSIKEYKEGCKQLTAAGSKKARQAWYELAIKENLNVNMGDSIYYINTGKKKGDSDVKRITKFYYMNNGEKIDYAVDEKGEKMLDRRGNVISLTKYLEKQFNLYKKEHKGTKTKIYDFGKTLFPNLEEDDIVIFNCVLLTNDLVEDEEDHFCDEDFEYNVDKYIEMFNKRIRPLLVVFDRNIRTYVNEKGKEIDNILITNPKDRKTFTEEETKLVSGQPFNETDQDTYEQLMTMEDKEIRFWLSIGKVPTYIEYIDGMDWEKIKEEYLLRQEEMKQDGIKQEIEQYNKIIENLTQNDVTELVEDGILPEKLLSIIDENFQTGIFKSKKWGIKLGTIYDIIDKDFNKTEEIEE